MRIEQQQRNRVETLKQLYIGKCQQLNKTNAALNCFKYQLLLAELLVLKSSIPEDELPVGCE